MNWRGERWFLGAAVLEPGRGGIARVARMTAKTLIEEGAVTRLGSLVDQQSVNVGGQSSWACGGRKLRFALQCHAEALRADRMLFDAVGPARAHPRLFGLRRPYGVWIHGVEVWDGLSEDRARALKSADFVLVNSEFTLQRFHELHFPLENAHVCWLATEEDSAPDLSIDPDGPPTVLLIGRSDRDNFRKGHTEVIAAWERVNAAIPEAELLLVGGGDGHDLLRDQVAASSASDRIKVMGFVPEAAMPALWARSNAFVQPSWKEGFGLVYIEAMRYSIPVIASIHDAGKEVNIDGETGYNINLDDRDALAARIVELLSDRNKAARMGAAGHARWKEHFRFSAFRKRLAGILDCVTENVST